MKRPIVWVANVFDAFPATSGERLEAATLPDVRRAANASGRRYVAIFRPDGMPEQFRIDGHPASDEAWMSAARSARG